MLKVCSIASGSNGNCYYIQHPDGTAILIDCGIGIRALESRLKIRHIDPHSIRAVFVSHAHSDHVCGLKKFCEKYFVPYYMTKGAHNACKSFYIPNDMPHFLFYETTVIVGSLSIHCFEKPHDSPESCSFRIEGDGTNVGVFTDIGADCPKLREHLALCDMAFYESNYDEEMLDKGKYPELLKRRIRGGEGHLSNALAADILRRIEHPRLKTLVLSHLSAHNNVPLLALKAFEDFKNDINITTASRFEVGPIIEVSNNA